MQSPQPRKRLRGTPGSNNQQPLTHPNAFDIIAQTDGEILWTKRTMAFAPTEHRVGVSVVEMSVLMDIVRDAGKPTVTVDTPTLTVCYCNLLDNPITDLISLNDQGPVFYEEVESLIKYFRPDFLATLHGNTPTINAMTGILSVMPSSFHMFTSGLDLAPTYRKRGTTRDVSGTVKQRIERVRHSPCTVLQNAPERLSGPCLYNEQQLATDLALAHLSNTLTGRWGIVADVTKDAVEEAQAIYKRRGPLAYRSEGRKRNAVQEWIGDLVEYRTDPN